MRVLHLLKTSVGASWALRQTRELARLGVEVHVALPSGPLVQRYVDVGVRVHEECFDIPLERPWEIPHILSRLRRLVALVRPDLIHSHFPATTLMARAALGKDHKTPRVFQVPGPLHLEHPLFRDLEVASAGSADYWIGSCRWTVRKYRTLGIPPDRIFFSYYGTDVEYAEEGKKGALRNLIGVGAETPIIGMVAYMYAPKRLFGQCKGLKGHEDLIDALAWCLDRRPGLKGVFIGGAWNGAFRYEGKIRAYGRARCGDSVVFLGTRDDVHKLYPDFDVAVHPSHSENVGGAVESFLHGIPTVTTDVGGFPDLVEPGVTGWLVRPRDPVGLGRAVLGALEDPERSRRMAYAGREKTRKLFDVIKTAKEVREIYLRILNA